MGRRRGFWAEWQHQQHLAQQVRQREYNAAVRAHNQAVRAHERAQREYQRAVAAAERMSAQERAAAERAAKEAYVAAQRFEAESRTAAAADALGQIDVILSAALSVDSYVDLESLRQVAVHPAFAAPEHLATPTPAPQLAAAPEEPMFVAPPEPSWFSKILDGTRQYDEAVKLARAEWEHKHRQWSDYVGRVLLEKNTRLVQQHAEAERKRAENLAKAIAAHQEECAAREREASAINDQLDQLRLALDAGDADAITAYIGIVLDSSMYPQAFTVEYDYRFDSEFGELVVAIGAPAPAKVPSVKTYRYLAASDEIRETPCSQKEQRDRYNGAVAAVTVRTFHEVFEADRAGHVKTISLTVQTNAINPATGLPETYPLVAATADRVEFSQFNLANVDPAETLAHMRALLSKNAFGLKPISTARGVR